MKKIIKIYAIVFLIIGCCYLFLLKERKEYNLVIEKKDEAYIKNKVFSVDSENRGYSDQAKKLMNQDLTQVNNDEIIAKLYAKSNIAERMIALSKTKKEFIRNFIHWTKVTQCLTTHMVKQHPSVRLKNFYNDKNSSEKISINLVIDALTDQYTSSNSVAEDQKLMNSFPTDKECEEMIN